MDSVSIRAYAKINWSLNVTGRREDGYHNLDTLMANVSLFDSLRIVLDPDIAPGTVSLFVDGGSDDVPADENNLVVRGIHAVETACGRQGGFRVQLFKRIPSRAGFGGGSADAAAAMTAAARLLHADETILPELAPGLGADVPFFLRGGAQRAQGIGEVLTPFSSATYHLVLATAPGGVSTKALFESFRCNMYRVRADNNVFIRALGSENLPLIQINCINQLTDAATRLVPAVCEYIKALESCHGCVCASMSGSGSGVFGLFVSETLAARACLELKRRGLARVAAVRTMDRALEIE